MEIRLLMPRKTDKERQRRFQHRVQKKALTGDVATENGPVENRPDVKMGDRQATGTKKWADRQATGPEVFRRGCLKGKGLVAETCSLCNCEEKGCGCNKRNLTLLKFQV
jgi:hypothetical protein